jgi:hypothetical protein
MQALIVAVIVGAALVHVAWTLLPARARRGLARWLLAHSAALGVPQVGRVWLHRHSQSVGGCGCAGCDGRPPVAIRIHRQPPKN